MGEPMLTLEQCREHIGCSKTTLWKIMNDPDLAFPALRIGRLVRVPRAEFETWLKSLPYARAHE